MTDVAVIGVEETGAPRLEILDDGGNGKPAGDAFDPLAGDAATAAAQQQQVVPLAQAPKWNPRQAAELFAAPHNVYVQTRYSGDNNEPVRKAGLIDPRSDYGGADESMAYLLDATPLSPAMGGILGLLINGVIVAANVWTVEREKAEAIKRERQRTQRRRVSAPSSTQHNGFDPLRGAAPGASKVSGLGVFGVAGPGAPSPPSDNEFPPLVDDQGDVRFSGEHLQLLAEADYAADMERSRYGLA